MLYVVDELLLEAGDVLSLPTCKQFIHNQPEPGTS